MRRDTRLPNDRSGRSRSSILIAVGILPSSSVMSSFRDDRSVDRGQWTIC